jgi:hypothetical protein
MAEPLAGIAPTLSSVRGLGNATNVGFPGVPVLVKTGFRPVGLVRSKSLKKVMVPFTRGKPVSLSRNNCCKAGAIMNWLFSAARMRTLYSIIIGFCILYTYSMVCKFYLTLLHSCGKVFRMWDILVGFFVIPIIIKLIT